MTELELRRAKLSMLPLCAVVALASRCGRRVQPQLGSVREPDREIFERMIATSESFAKNGFANFLPKTSVINAVADTGNVDAAKTPDSTVIPNHNLAYASCAIISAYQAAENAAAVNVLETVTHALNATTFAGILEAAALEASEVDYGRLFEMKLGLPGTLGQPIDPSESGPLGPFWPQGEPEWYRNPSDKPDELEVSFQPIGDSELVFEIEVPEDASDEEIIAMAARIALEADGLHRAYGGQGLQVERLEIHQGVLEPTGVPRG